MISSNPNSAIPNQWETPDELAKVAVRRMRQGFAPPVEIHQVQHRRRIAWGEFPDWARPVDPEIFDSCGHEG